MKKRLLSLALAFMMLLGGFIVGGDVAFAQTLEYQPLPNAYVVRSVALMNSLPFPVAPGRILPRYVPPGRLQPLGITITPGRLQPRYMPPGRLQPLRIPVTPGRILPK